MLKTMLHFSVVKNEKLNVSLYLMTCIIFRLFEYLNLLWKWHVTQTRATSS